MGKEQNVENEYNIKEVYNLTLIRNNSQAVNKLFRSDENVYFLLDYFNFLKVRKLVGDRSGYEALCGTDKIVSAITTKTMGLYALMEKKEKEKNFFEIAKEGENNTSAYPFLGVVQVYIIDYECESQNGNKKFELYNVQKQLLEYRIEIEKELEKSANDVRDFQIFQTITSEDFLVVLRSDDLRKMYGLIARIIAMKKSKGFFTYTNIGIECRKCEERNFLHLQKSIIEKNEEIQFAVRFKTEASALGEIHKLCADENKMEIVNGLFGRYDLLVRINIEQFCNIYPYICQNQTGEMQSVAYEGTDILIIKLIEWMQKKVIKTINVRALIDLREFSMDGFNELEPWFDADRRDLIKNRQEEINKLKKTFKEKFGNRMLIKKYQYRELDTMLERLLGAYENLAYEVDAHINWYICSDYLEMLYRNMNIFMSVMEEDETRAVDKFLKELQKFIKAFEEYIRLIQGSNQHTNQSPRYDIVAPIDGQKFLIAYSEYINDMHDIYCNYGWENKMEKEICKEKRKRAMAIIYPKAAGTIVQMENVFQCDRVSVDRRKEETDTEEKICCDLLLCGIPMFEYFERTYDLIPLISHETCHSMLVLNRRERNSFLIKKIFENIAEEVSYYMQVEAAGRKGTIKYDSLTVLFKDCLAECFEEEYKTNYAKEWEKYVSVQIPVNLTEFMKIYFKEENVRRYGTGNLSWNENMKRGYELIMEIGGGELLKNLEEIQILHQEENEENELEKRLIKEKEIKEKIRSLYILLENKIRDMFQNDRNIEVQTKEIKQGSYRYKEREEFLIQWNKKLSEKYGNNNTNDNIKYYVELIDRAYKFYTEADYHQGVYVQDDGRRFALRFAEAIWDKYQREFLNGEKYLIYNAEMIRQVNYWEMSNIKHAAMYYQEAFSRVSADRVKRVIDRTVSWYRESCADIIMCRWLGFNSFGYFRMAISLLHKMEGYEEQMEHSGALRDRLAIVLAVLLNEERGEIKETGGISEISMKKLKENIEAYLNNEIIYAKERILDAAKRDEDIMKKAKEKSEDEEEWKKKVDAECEKFFQIFGEQTKYIWDSALEGKPVVWKDGIWSEVCEKDNLMFEGKLLHKYFQSEINLYRRLFFVVDAFGKLYADGNLRVATDDLYHMALVYRNSVSDIQQHTIVEKVVKFYNEPNSGNTTNAEKMKDMIRFVQDYYYFNRYKKAQEEKECMTRMKRGNNDEDMVCKES